MKKFTFALSALLFFPVMAFAYSFEAAGVDWRPYVSADAQLSLGFVEVETPNTDWGLKSATSIGGLFNFGLGVKHERVRMELSYLTRGSSNDIISWLLTGVVSVSSERAGMLNFYYDYLSTRVFAMYIGAGAGVSQWKQTTNYAWLGSDHTYIRDGTDFIGGVYTGMSFTIADAFSIDLGFSYYHTNTLKFNSLGLKLGTRYTF
ncbi:MAG: outer membrane beta-barrel protein [Endomicrobium sp.]|jgi:opacity protein-like surface antigen|nr:outer membrane beta-barrel protein [Endomicrobium sp.]